VQIFQGPAPQMSSVRKIRWQKCRSHLVSSRARHSTITHCRNLKRQLWGTQKLHSTFC